MKKMRGIKKLKKALSIFEKYNFDYDLDSSIFYTTENVTISKRDFKKLKKMYFYPSKSFPCFMEGSYYAKRGFGFKPPWLKCNT